MQDHVHPLLAVRDHSRPRFLRSSLSLMSVMNTQRCARTCGGVVMIRLRRELPRLLLDDCRLSGRHQAFDVVESRFLVTFCELS